MPSTTAPTSYPTLAPFTLGKNETSASAQRRFLNAHPAYAKTSPIDELRKRDFKRLKMDGTYLDYTGSGLYPESLVKEHLELLQKNVFGNPHSASPSSVLSSKYAAAARLAVLNFFDADPAQYDVVFTTNASTALRLIGESYTFAPSPESVDGKSRLVLPVDAHNSVNGLREFAKKAGAEVLYIPMEGHAPVHGADAPWPALAPENGAGSLFVVTGQSNLSGYKSDLNLLVRAKANGYNTVLDAAALAPTTPISLRKLGGNVDAMAISLYKMIGYPTGLGCLIVRKDFQRQKMQKPWFSGGSVMIVQSPGDGRLLLSGHERWEDGTINFLSLSAIPRGLQILHNHLPYLTQRLPHLMHFTLSSLASLKHSNGKPVIELLSPASPEAYNPKTHGAIISLLMLTPSGERIAPRDVEAAASALNIHIRAGCLCNPGASTHLLGIDEMMAGFEFQYYDDNDGIKDTPESAEKSFAQSEDMTRFVRYEGVVRMGFGLASILEDAGQFITFARRFIDLTRPVSALIPAGKVGADGHAGIGGKEGLPKGWENKATSEAVRQGAQAPTVQILREDVPTELGGAPKPEKTLRKRMSVGGRLYRMTLGRRASTVGQ